MNTCIHSHSFCCAECYVCGYFKSTYPQYHIQITSSVSSIERKYQKPCDYIDKGPKQEIRAQEIHICFPENKELEATETKHQVVFPLQEMFKPALETSKFSKPVVNGRHVVLRQGSDVTISSAHLHSILLLRSRKKVIRNILRILTDL